MALEFASDHIYIESGGKDDEDTFEDGLNF